MRARKFLNTSRTQVSFSTLRSGIQNYMIEMATRKFTSDNTVWPHEKIADCGLCSKRQATSYCGCVCRRGTTKSGGPRPPWPARFRRQCIRHQCNYICMMHQYGLILCIHGSMLCICHQNGLMLSIRHHYGTIIYGSMLCRH